MPCYRSIGAATADIAWAGDGSPAVWIQDLTAHDAPEFRLVDLSYNLLDSVADACTSGQYSAAPWFTVDDNGTLFWAERGSTTLVFPTLPHAIAVYALDIATNTSTQLFTLNGAGATTDQFRKDHQVGGLEWNQAEGRVYIAWLDNRSASLESHVASFLPDGTDYTDHLSGTGSPHDYLGPIVFDPDGVSMWIRTPAGAGLFWVGHVELGSYTVTTDPTAGASIVSNPGIPRTGGMVWSDTINSFEWQTVVYDNPGFTVADASCPDDRGIGSTAYAQAPYSNSRTAFTDGVDLYVPGAWHVGYVGSR